MGYAKDYKYNKEEPLTIKEDGQVVAQTINMEGPLPSLGLLLMAIGVLCLTIGLMKPEMGLFFIGLFGLVLSAFLIFSIKRIAYNKQKKQLRVYTEYFIFKKGEWVSLTDFNAVRVSCVEALPYASENNRIWYKERQVYFNVYLSSQGRARLPLFVFIKKEDAIKFQNKISGIIAIPANPQIIRVVATKKR